MTTSLSSLTAAVLDALAATPGLSTVRLAAEPGPPDGANLPAGTLVLLDATTTADIDRLTRVRFELTIFRRDVDPQANVLALAELADAVAETVLTDPSLGGLAVPGPGGAATEVARVGPGKASSPLACIVLQIACHVLPAESLAPAPPDQQVLIDGESMLASGPVTVAIGQFQRRRVDRTFAGLDGMVSIDLGATSRPIALSGRLVADDLDGLVEQMARLSGLNATAELHAIGLGDGRMFPNVRLERIDWGRTLSAGADARAAVAYEITFAQLAE